MQKRKREKKKNAECVRTHITTVTTDLAFLTDTSAMHKVEIKIDASK